YMPLLGCMSVFFFSSRRRHTRFSRDWSSDVCSSDLEDVLLEFDRVAELAGGKRERSVSQFRAEILARDPVPVAAAALAAVLRIRSEERRVGKECGSRGARYREKQRRQ